MRNPDIIMTVHQETRGEILFHRKIGNRELDERKNLLSKNSDTQNREIPKRLQPSISEDRWQQINASSYRHFGVQGFLSPLQQDLATHEIAIREIPIRSQLSILDGHVADIEATIGIQGFTLTEVWIIASRDIPRTHQVRPSILDAWLKSGDSEKVPKRKAPSAHRDSGNWET